MEGGSKALSRGLVVLAIAVAVGCSWLPAIQDLADRQIDEGLKRALVAFAAARTLNAVISVAQSTQVTAQVGVGATVALGEALDPINDLVEQFARVMLTASIVFGVQKALLAIGGHWIVSATVTGVALLWIALYPRGSTPVWLSRLLLVLLVVRFAIPAAVIGSDLAFQHFLAPQYLDATKSIESVTEKVDGASEPPTAAAKPRDWITAIKDFFSIPPSLKNPVERLAELTKVVSDLTDQLVRLMVVFVVQTVVLPIVLLWAILRLAGGLLSSPASTVMVTSATAR